MKTEGPTDRAGTVNFHDASLAVWEDGTPAKGQSCGLDPIWERDFKRQVFARIVQTLNRLGWTFTMPAISDHDVKHYGGDVARWSAERKRYCTKGDLKADLSVSGRHIEFKMFQNVNAPDRPDHEGRYQFNKERHMPYVLRLEMERTRSRIRDYLCNVFTGYTYEDKYRPLKPLDLTAMQQVQKHYEESSHFKGDLESYLKRNKYPKLPTYNTKSADGQELQHGQRVWFRDRYSGRAATGIALYNINNMWWVVTGRYDYTNVACFELHAAPPENLRGRHFPDLRRKRLEQELAKATAAMKFERAAVLRDVLFPPGTGPLFHVRRKNDGVFWGPDSCGYTKDTVRAGKYTESEAQRITQHSNGELEATPAGVAA